jgi:hypothetical protein
MAVLGGVLASGLALRRGGPRDVPPAAFAGAFTGVLLAVFVVAACRTIEPPLGSGLGSSRVAVSLLWAVLGAALGALSTLLIPPPRRAGESP